MNTKNLIIGLILAVVVAAGGFWLGQSQTQVASGSEPLEATGVIEARTVSLAPEVGGRVVEVLVEEGQRVTVGQPLVRLDDALLMTQRLQALAALQAAQANLALLQTGARDEQIAAAEAQLAQAQANQRIAQANLDLLEAGATAEQIAAAEAQVAQTEANTRMTQANLDALVNGARAEEITVAQAQVDAAQAQLNALDVQLAKYTLTAPGDGVVLTRSAEPGEAVMPGATLMQIDHLDLLELTVYLPEDRFGLVTPGQTAEVRVDTYSDRVFAGTVLRVADNAEFTPTNIQTKEDRTRLVYAVKISLDNADLLLKPGMIADVVFDR